jgi:hypothetical protein
MLLGSIQIDELPSTAATQVNVQVNAIGVLDRYRSTDSAIQRGCSVVWMISRWFFRHMKVTWLELQILV